MYDNSHIKNVCIAYGLRVVDYTKHGLKVQSSSYVGIFDECAFSMLNDLAHHESSMFGKLSDGDAIGMAYPIFHQNAHFIMGRLLNIAFLS